MERGKAFPSHLKPKAFLLRKRERAECARVHTCLGQQSSVGSSHDSQDVKYGWRSGAAGSQEFYTYLTHRLVQLLTKKKIPSLLAWAPPGGILGYECHTVL